ncbi:MAG: MFS transporter [Chloroflexi bacterium]|nr:MFS transporter [Chloroflexota bacterium]
MKLQRTGLWHHPDFTRLWAGQTISALGSQIGGTALTFTAILTLQATPLQLGWLETARALPVLLLGLLAGVWVDRLRRRPVLMVADLGRALLLATIPVAALLGILHMAQLYVVAALVGALALFFDVAYPAYLPSLVKPDELVEGNSKLSMTSAVAEIGGPGLGGALVQLITPPLAILFDACSFLISALSLGLIRSQELAPVRHTTPDAERPAGIIHEMAEGVRVILGDPILRALLGCAATTSLTSGIIGTLYALYMVQELGLSPLWMGIVIGVGGVSALIGAFLAEPVTRRFGIGPAMIGARLLAMATSSLMVLAWGPPLVILPLLLISQAADATWSIYGINETSLRQAITPHYLLGRVNASERFLTGIIFPVGALLGGLLGQTIGLRAAITIGLLIGALATLWLVFSPVRKLEKI